MKKILVSIIACIMLSGFAGAASAAVGSNSLRQGSFGLSVGIDNNTQFDFIVINGRYFFQDDLAATLGFGFKKQTGDLNGKYFAIALGVRKYLKTDEFAPFFEGKLTIESQDLVGDTDTIDLSANFGAEYFLHKQFSIEGSVGLSVGSVDNNAVPNSDYTYIGTKNVGVRANFYF